MWKNVQLDGSHPIRPITKPTSRKRQRRVLVTSCILILGCFTVIDAFSVQTFDSSLLTRSVSSHVDGASQTNMFLQCASPSLRIISGYKSLQPWKTQSPGNQLDLEVSQNSPHHGQRGLLGFDMALFSTQQQPQQHDFIDDWKNLQDWQDESTVVNNYVGLSKRTPSNWLPWIPTHDQIASLKRTELQQACVERQLKKSGLKAELQERLWEWSQQEQERQALLQSNCRDLLQGFATVDNDRKKKSRPTKKPKDQTESSANSLAEWARTVDLEPLLQRREKIHRGKHQPKQPARKPISRDDYLDKLTRTFEQPSSDSNNAAIKNMYIAAKHADQRGDRVLARQLLEELLVATPHDARLYRRLARLYQQQRQNNAARAVLRQGLLRHSQNPHLWQGLAQLSDDKEEKMTYYSKAIEVDPTFPNAYHALGTLQHDAGYIAKARKTIKQGLAHCPTNHRLHHALGDLYRDAKLLDMAVKSFKNALYHGPKISHGFSYVGLAYCAYERDDPEQCRQWLRRTVELNPRQSQAWLALAQMKEALDKNGTAIEAKQICVEALDQYERGLLLKSRKYGRSRGVETVSDIQDEKNMSAVALRNQFLQHQVPVYRSGDRFFHVYRNWLRLEVAHPTTSEATEAAFERATAAFPYKSELYLDWANYGTGHYSHDKIQALLQQAADVARDGYSHYRLASFVMNQRDDLVTARKLFYRGAIAVGKRTDKGLAELYLNWAVCEWRLGELDRAEHLLDHAMRLSTSSTMRSFLLYGMARLEFTRGEYALAQHCIGLSLKESFPRNADRRAVWKLWVLVAEAMDNSCLAEQCQEQVTILGRQDAEDEGTTRSVDLKDLTRREPWYFAIHPSKSNKVEKWNSGVRLPNLEM